MKKIFICLYEAAINTINHDGVEHAGYMSFMILLSIFPFIIFFLAITSFVGASELGQHFIELLLENMPEHTTDLIKNRLNEISKTPPQSLLTLAIVGSIWTASSFVECLRTILNRVHNITTPPTYIRRRLLSIIQFFIISLLISFTVTLLIIVPIALGKIPNITDIIKGYGSILNLSRYLLTPIILFLATSLLYYIVPNVKLAFVDVVPGSILTVLLWVCSGHLLSSNIIYYNQLNIVYGSLGSIIVTLIFFYIINTLFIYGAEFNHAIICKRIADNASQIKN